MDDPPPGMLALLPRLTPPLQPDGVEPGFDIDPDAGRPSVLATPAAPQTGPEVEGFDQSSVDPVVFDSKSIEEFRDKLNKQLRHVKPSDLDAARQERAGKVVAIRPDGIPFDHETEVLEAVAGMMKLTRDLMQRLSYPGLSDADRQAATALLSEASRKIEEMRRMVLGIEKKLGAYK